METKDENKHWVTTDGRPVEEVTASLIKQMHDLEELMKIPDNLQKITELMEEVQKGTKHVPVSDFNLVDVSLVKILKNKYVCKQIYDVAAQLRDVEKDLMIRIDEQARRKQEDRANEIEESIEFGRFLLDNYTTVSWHLEEKNEKGELIRVSAFIKKGDNGANGESPKTFTTEETYELFQLTKIKKHIDSLKSE